MRPSLRASGPFLPTLIFEATCIRNFWFGRFESYPALIVMMLLLAFISLGAAYFSLRPDVSDEVVEQFLPKIRDLISFPPGRLLIYFLNGLNYAGAVCFFLSMLRPGAEIRW